MYTAHVTVGYHRKNAKHNSDTSVILYIKIIYNIYSLTLKYAFLCSSNKIARFVRKSIVETANQMRAALSVKTCKNPICGYKKKIDEKTLFFFFVSHKRRVTSPHPIVINK